MFAFHQTCLGFSFASNCDFRFANQVVCFLSQFTSSSSSKNKLKRHKQFNFVTIFILYDEFHEKLINFQFLKSSRVCGFSRMLACLMFEDSAFYVTLFYCGVIKYNENL